MAKDAPKFATIPITLLLEDERNMRTDYGEDLPPSDPHSLDALAASLKKNGCLENLGVVAHEDGKHWFVAFGNRRLRAAHKAGLETLPCMCYPAGTNVRRIQIEENAKRKRPNVVEMARAISAMVAESQARNRQQSVANDIGLSKGSISRYMAIADLPEAVLKKYEDIPVAERPSLEALYAMADWSEEKQLLWAATGKVDGVEAPKPSKGGPKKDETRPKPSEVDAVITGAGEAFETVTAGKSAEYRTGFAAGVQWLVGQERIKAAKKAAAEKAAKEKAAAEKAAADKVLPNLHAAPAATAEKAPKK